MSNRTAQANNAVAKAWEQEKARVLQGEGTRDWTQKQQQEIIETGRAKDIKGRAVQGHHMKSVEMYPEFQGDADNIQFLEVSEHLEAHCGSYRNPSNGYYNPQTREITSFGDGRYQKCKVIKLSDPLYVPELKINDFSGTKGVDKPKGSIRNYPSKTLGTLGKIAGKAKDFYSRHQGIINTVGATALIVGEEVARRKIVGGGSGGGSTAKKIAEAVSTGKEIVDRASPIEHAVKGYVRMQNGKPVKVASYIRGVKK